MLQGKMPLINQRRIGPRRGNHDSAAQAVLRLEVQGTTGLFQASRIRQKWRDTMSYVKTRSSQRVFDP
jgi:hypothetical protein